MKALTPMRSLKYALLSLLAGVAVVVLLFFGPLVLPVLESLDKILRWSQSFWQPIFPPPPVSSAPSGNCYLAMLMTDTVIVAVPIFVLFVILSRLRKDRNA
jgi:hypothetical protein